MIGSGTTSRARRYRALALVAASMAGGAGATDPAVPGAVVPESADASFLREIGSGHFVHVGRHEDMSPDNGGDVANGGFVVGGEGVAVIDPGGATAHARTLLRAIRRTTALPITHVVLTHFHPDHVLGAAVFTDAEAHAGSARGGGDGARSPVVVAHARHARAMAQRGPYYLERYAALVDAPGRLAVPTLGLEAGETVEIDLGGRTLEVRAWPTGHTDNDVSVFDAHEGTLWAGDLLVEGRTPSLDGSLPGWLAVLDDLDALGATRVIPGHGEPGAPGPMLDAERRYLRELLGDTRERLAAGGHLADALAAAERAPPGHWRLFGLHHPANVTRAWTELEWE